MSGQVQYSCTYQGYEGTLVADAMSCCFNSEFVKAEFLWENVKWIRVMTRHVKDVPTSVLTLKVMRVRGPSGRVNNSGKHYFYHLVDIVEVARELQALKGAASASEAPSRTSPSDVIADVNENSVSIPGGGRRPVPSATTVSGSVGPYQAANTTVGNIRHGREGSLLFPEKAMTAPAGGASLFSRADEDLTSLSSTGAGRRNANNRDNEGEALGGRSTIAGGGVILSSAQSRGHPGTRVNAPSGKRREKQRGAGGGSFFSRCQDCLCSNLFESPLHTFLTFGLVLTVLFVLVLVPRLLLGVGDENHWHEPLPDDMVSHVSHALERLQQWRTELYDMVLKTNSKQGMTAPMMATVMRSAPPVTVTLKDMTAAIRELLARYVLTQQQMIAARLHRVRREYDDMSLVFNEERCLLDGDIDDPLFGFGEEKDTSGNDADDIDDIDDNDNNKKWFQKKSEKKQPQRRFSTARIKSDINRLKGYVYKILSGVKWLFTRLIHFPSHNKKPAILSFLKGVTSSNGNKPHGRYGVSTGNMKNQDLVRYTERLANGQIVTQYVTPEEFEDRRTCLRLTRDLLRLSKLIEGLLLEYQDVVMEPLYETYLHQVFSNLDEANKVSLSLGAATGETIIPDELEYNGLLAGENGELLRFILLRRHALFFLHLDPLIQSEGDRYHELIRTPQETRFYASSKLRRKNGRNGNKTSSMERMPTREIVEDILREFVKSTTRTKRSTVPHLEDSLVMMRNLLRELQYWHEHEEEWQTIISWRLNSSSTNQGAANKVDGVKEEEDDEYDEYFQKAVNSLPFFRGLWCFMKQPLMFPERPKNKAKETASSSSSPSVSTPSEEPQGEHDTAATKTLNDEDTLERENVFVNDFEKREILDREEDGQGDENKRKEDDYMGSEKKGMESQTDPLGGMNELQRQEEGNEMATMEDAIRREELEAEEEREETEDDDDIDSGIRTIELLSQKANIRWLNAFDLFLRSHENPRKRQSPNKRVGLYVEKQYEMDEEEEDDKVNMRYIRYYLIKLIVRAKHQYERLPMSDWINSLARSGVVVESSRQCHPSMKLSLWRIFWPPSWFSGTKTISPLSCWLWRLKGTDPVVQNLYRDVLGVPLGDVEDLPWMLLYILSTPSELLRIQHKVHILFYTMSWSFLVVLAAVIVVAVFL